MLVRATRHFVHGAAADVIFLEWLVPQRRVRRVVTREGRVDGHRAIGLVRQAVDDVVVALVNSKLCSVLAFLSMPKLAQRRQFVKTTQAPLSVQSPCQHRHVTVVATQPVASKAPLAVVERIGHLQIAETQHHRRTDARNSRGMHSTITKPVHSGGREL